MQNDEHPPSLRDVDSEKLKNMLIDTVEFIFCKLSQAADDYAGLYNSFTLYISSTDVLTGNIALEKTLLLLAVITAHRKPTTTVEARERAEGRQAPQ